MSSKKIIMGKQSSLGPVDPQLNGLPARGVIDDFERAKKEMTKARNKGETGTIDAWQAILSNYSPSLIDHCYKSIKWSEKMLKNNLKTGMFDGEDDFSNKFDKIKELFSETENSKTHNRHYSMKKLKDNTDLKIEAMEEDDDYQDKILSVHHAAMHTLGNTTTVKIIENHEGRAFMSHIRNKKN